MGRFCQCSASKKKGERERGREGERKMNEVSALQYCFFLCVDVVCGVLWFVCSCVSGVVACA